MTRPESNPPPDEASDPPASGPAGAADRPEWLVGPDEGVEGERKRTERAKESGERLELERPTPKLVRPETDEAWNTLPTELRDRSSRAEKPAKPAKPAKPSSWAAAGNSVPRLSHDATRTPRAEAPPSESDKEEEDEATFTGPPGAAADRASAPRPAVKPPHEPFYVVWLDALATNRALQIGITVGVAVVVAGWAFWPREHGASVAQIKRHPASFEGRAVRIHGRVGEVFAMGQGYVFNLHQGRDTVVVFSRMRVPRPRQRVDVTGTVSTGYLDGVPRVALFETGP